MAQGVSVTVTLNDRITQVLAKINKGWDKFTTRIEGVQKRLDKVAASSQAFSASMNRVAIGVAAAGTSIFSASAKFDKALTQSTAIIDGLSGETLSKLDKKAKEVSHNLTVYASDVAEAYFFLFSAGLSPDDALNSIGTVAKFAVAGQFELAKATEILADTQGALGKKTADVTQNYKEMLHIANSLVRANTIAQGTVEEFAIALQNKAGAAAKTYNIALEDTLALLAVFASRGKKGEFGGTLFEQFTRIIKQIGVNPAAQAVARKNEISIFDDLGRFVGIEKFIRSFTEAIEELEEQERATLIKGLGIADRTQQAVLLSIGAADAFKDYKRQLSDVGGFIDRVATRQMDNLSDAFRILVGQIQNIAIEIGQALTPTLREWGLTLASVLVSVYAWAKSLTEINTATKEWVVALSGSVFVVTALAFAVRTIAFIFKGLLPVIAGVAGGFKLLLTLFVAHPFVAAAATIAAITAAVFGLSSAAKEAEPSVTKLLKNASGDAILLQKVLNDVSNDLVIARQKLNKLEKERERVVRGRGEGVKHGLFMQSYKLEQRDDPGARNRETINKKIEEAKKDVENREKRHDEARIGYARERYKLQEEAADVESENQRTVLTEEERLLNLYGKKIYNLRQFRAELFKIKGVSGDTLGSLTNAIKLYEEAIENVKKLQGDPAVTIADLDKIGIVDWKGLEAGFAQIDVAAEVYGDTVTALEEKIKLMRAEVKRVIDAYGHLGSAFLLSREEFKKLISRIESGETTLEKWTEDIEESEKFTKALAKATREAAEEKEKLKLEEESVSGFAKGLMAATEEAKTFGRVMFILGEEIAHSLASAGAALVDMFIQGEVNLKKWAGEFLRQIALITTQLAIMNLIQSAGGGIGGIVGKNAGGQVRRAGGGPVPGPSHVNHDMVSALLTPLEWVIKKASSQYYGPGIMSAINEGRFKREDLRELLGSSSATITKGKNRFATGGQVSGNGGQRTALVAAPMLFDKQTVDRIVAQGEGAIKKVVQKNIKELLRSGQRSR